jgi:hypothetical protein
MDYRAWMQEWGVLSIERLDGELRVNLNPERYPFMNAVSTRLTQHGHTISEHDALRMFEKSLTVEAGE